MSNEAFKSAFAKVLAKAGNKAEMVVRSSMLDMVGAVIEPSPVDKGTFKSNWQGGIGSVNYSTSDAAGSDSRSKIEAVLTGWKAGQSFWITNSMPYAQRLEYGWSKIAPQGMVRIAVQNFKSDIQKRAGETK